MSSSANLFRLASTENVIEFKQYLTRINAIENDKEKDVLMKTMFTVDTKGRQLTHVAAKCGCLRFLSLLCQIGFNVNIKCNRGNTPLHYACIGTSLPCIMTLLGFGADINILNNVFDSPLDVIPQTKHARLASLVRTAVRQQRILQKKSELCKEQNAALFKSIVKTDLYANPYPLSEIHPVDVNSTDELAQGPGIKYCTAQFSSMTVMVMMKLDPHDSCLLEEANNLRYLRHPNILLLLGINNNTLLVFEHPPQGFLHRALFRSNLTLNCDEIFHIAKDIAAALKYLHGAGFIHCAVASFSITLHRNRTAKLCNFANIQSIKNRHPISHLTSLYPYMAAEQLHGYPANEANDIYGLGAVLYECSTREKIQNFKETSKQLNKKADMSSMMKRIPCVNTSLFLLMQACLGKPKRRPTAEQIANWLNASLNNRHATLTPVSMPRDCLQSLEFVLDSIQTQ